MSTGLSDRNLMVKFNFLCLNYRIFLIKAEKGNNFTKFDDLYVILCTGCMSVFQNFPWVTSPEPSLVLESRNGIAVCNHTLCGLPLLGVHVHFKSITQVNK